MNVFQKELDELTEFEESSVFRFLPEVVKNAILLRMGELELRLDKLKSLSK